MFWGEQQPVAPLVWRVVSFSGKNYLLLTLILHTLPPMAPGEPRRQEERSNQAPAMWVHTT